jgi:hypothetical protein
MKLGWDERAPYPGFLLEHITICYSNLFEILYDT